VQDHQTAIGELAYNYAGTARKTPPPEDGAGGRSWHSVVGGPAFVTTEDHLRPTMRLVTFGPATDPALSIAENKLSGLAPLKRLDPVDLKGQGSNERENPMNSGILQETNAIVFGAGGSIGAAVAAPEVRLALPLPRSSRVKARKCLSRDALGRVSRIWRDKLRAPAGGRKQQTWTPSHRSKIA
jgi:hypothetical protein